MQKALTSNITFVYIMNAINNKHKHRFVIENLNFLR